MILAQAQNAGPSWEWIVTVVCIPLILAAITLIYRRLARGDDKFEALIKQNAAFEQVLQAHSESNREITISIRKIAEKIAESNAEIAGQLGQLQAKFSKEYVRREEFYRFQDGVESKFAHLQKSSHVHEGQ